MGKNRREKFSHPRLIPQLINAHEVSDKLGISNLAPNCRHFKPIN